MPLRKERLEELRIDRSSDASGQRWSAWLGAAVAAVLAIGALVWWLLWPPAVSVRTARARQVSTPEPTAVLDASGYVTARRQATVSAEITGRIVEVLVEEGMEVREGQVLARLDDSLVRASLALAEAEFESARKRLEETRVLLHEAEINLERVRRLVAEGFESEARLDAAEAEVGSLRARLESGREEIEVASRRVAVRRQELENTIIRAPFSGVAISKDAQPGEMISPVTAGGGFTRTGICTVVDMSSLEIEVDVNEAYINRVEPRQPVEAVLDAYPGWTIPAQVITSVPAADRQRATVKVRIAFDQLDPRILPDMGVKVRFLDLEGPDLPTPGPQVVIPASAVRAQDGRDVVFVVVDGRLEGRVVRLGSRLGSEIEVLSGLAAGEPVVVEGAEGLADGDRVQVE